MRIPTALALLALLSLVTTSVGCSQKEGDHASDIDAGGADGGADAPGAQETGDAPSSALTPADFESQLAKLNCQFMVRCGFLAAAEESACEAQVDAQKDIPLPYSVAVAASEGRLAYSGQAALDCLAQTKVKGCTAEEQVAAGEACDTVFTGAVANGDICKARLECANGYCARAKYARDGCPGACAAFTPTGSACDLSANHCAPTDYCDGTAKICKARGASGDPCGPDGPFCKTGVFCVSGTCRSHGALGDACVFGIFGSSCTPGLYCDGSGASPTCANRGAAGSACASLDACANGLDCVGLAIDPNTGAVTSPGKCGAFLDDGSTCDATLSESGCPGGTTCDPSSKRCARFGFEGAACGGSANVDCRENLYCDSTAKCASAVPIGQSCAPPAAGSPNPCYPSTVCDPTAKTCTLLCQ